MNPPQRFQQHWPDYMNRKMLGPEVPELATMSAGRHWNHVTLCNIYSTVTLLQKRQ